MIRNGASNACVYTKATVQAMPLFPQTQKTISFPLREADGFLLVVILPQQEENKNNLSNIASAAFAAVEDEGFEFA